MLMKNTLCHVETLYVRRPYQQWIALQYQQWIALQYQIMLKHFQHLILNAKFWTLSTKVLFNCIWHKEKNLIKFYSINRTNNEHTNLTGFKTIYSTEICAGKL
jgi:hypothetical protein